MYALRSSSRLLRLVLAWFALTLGVAIASPLVHPQSMQLVCGDGPGAKLVVVNDDGQAAGVGHHTLDCPACLATALPPAPVVPELPTVLPQAHALHSFYVAHIAALLGAPLPPRGPPSLA